MVKPRGKVTYSNTPKPAYAVVGEPVKLEDSPPPLKGEGQGGGL